MDGLVGQDGGGFAHEDGLVGQDGGGYAHEDGLQTIRIMRIKIKINTMITYVGAEVGGDGPGGDIDVEKVL